MLLRSDFTNVSLILITIIKWFDNTHVVSSVCKQVSIRCVSSHQFELCFLVCCTPQYMLMLWCWLVWPRRINVISLASCVFVLVSQMRIYFNGNVSLAFDLCVIEGNDENMRNIRDDIRKMKEQGRSANRVKQTNKQNYVLHYTFTYYILHYILHRRMGQRRCAISRTTIHWRV